MVGFFENSPGEEFWLGHDGQCVFCFGFVLFLSLFLFNSGIFFGISIVQQTATRQQGKARGDHGSK